MKILFLDIETAPIEGYVWGKWEQNLSSAQIKHDWFILCYCAKWKDEKKMIQAALPDYKDAYRRNKRNDRQLMLGLKKLLDKADVVVTHNGIKFDHKKINARFMHHNILPSSPFLVVDTLRAIKSVSKHTSHKLDDLVKGFKLGKKHDTGGFELWVQCIERNKEAWKTMVAYCVHDVVLLEKLYIRILPWIKNHPNYANYLDSTRPMCTNCGNYGLIKTRGDSFTKLGRFANYVCKACGTQQRSRVNKNTKKLQPNKLMLVA